MISVGIITISDRASSRVYQDLSGPKLKKILTQNKDFDVRDYQIIPDGESQISDKIKFMADSLGLDIIFTTGGTGVGLRDVTPEATKKLIDRELPGIQEFIRRISLEYTQNAMLSRGIAGIRKKSFIINLPGSPKAIEQILPLILQSLMHGVGIVKGELKE